MALIADRLCRKSRGSDSPLECLIVVAYQSSSVLSEDTASQTGFILYQKVQSNPSDTSEVNCMHLSISSREAPCRDLPWYR